MYTSNLKAHYIDYLLSQENGCFQSWQRAIESGKNKRAAKYMRAWEAVVEERQLVETEGAGSVAIYIMSSRETNALCADFCWKMWGYVPQRRYELATL